MVYSQLRRKEFSSLKISMDEKIEAGLSEFDKTQMSGIALDETIALQEIFDLTWA